MSVFALQLQNFQRQLSPLPKRGPYKSRTRKQNGSKVWKTATLENTNGQRLPHLEHLVYKRLDEALAKHGEQLTTENLIISKAA